MTTTLSDTAYAKITAQQAAARAMLAALQAFVAKIDPAILVEHDLSMSPLADELRGAFAAIESAKAAGILSQEECPACNGLGADPKTGLHCDACAGGGVIITAEG